MSVTYEDNDNKECTNSSHVEGRRKPTATYIYIVTIFRIITDESSTDDDVDEWKNYIITDLLSTLCIYLNNIMHY